MRTFFPEPKEVNWGEGSLPLPCEPGWEADPNLPAEGYRITVNESGITAAAADAAGRFYAGQTLGQLLADAGTSLRYVEITDAPSLEVRGVMMDIGRDKIPTMETLYALIDKLAAMRYNSLQFSMEGFCFDYPAYRWLFPDDTPIRAEEFKALSRYAKERFIDLVPNQNCLGHMDQWLSRPELRDLAECPDGFLHENLYKRPPMTVDVNNPRTYELVEYFMDTLLPCFESGYFNVNLDEPFEIGQGKNKEQNEKLGPGGLYLSFIRRVHVMLAERGKRMMMWGDVLFSHPGLIAGLPKDITVLDWIYEGDATFEEHCKLLSRQGMRYCLCPGTSSWCSLTGRHGNMLKNVDDAVDCACRYGAAGIIMTDWGDLGHWQYLPVSYPAFAYAGSAMWSGKGNEALTEQWCNSSLFRDAGGKTYGLLRDLGSYYRHEHTTLYNTTLAFAVMASKYRFDTFEEFPARMERMTRLSENIAKGNGIPFSGSFIRPDYTALEELLDGCSRKANEMEPACEDAELIRAELKNSIRMIRHGLALYRVMTEHKPGEAAYRESMKALFAGLCVIEKEHYRLWCARNRAGGFSRSVSQWKHLLEFYRQGIADGKE